MEKAATIRGFILAILMFFLLSSDSLAQGISVNIDGSSPDASAMLDVQSTEKGVLVPRMSSSERTGISNPATGLLVYDNETRSFWFFNGNGWQEIKKGEELWSTSGTNTILENNGNVGIGTATPDEKLHINYGNIKITGDDQNLLSIIMEDENSGNEYSISAYEEIRLNTNSTARLTIETDGRVGIGTTAPENSALLDVRSTNKGVLFPRLTENQIDSISDPVDGLIVYNTDDHSLYIFNSYYYDWKQLDFGSGTIGTPFSCGDSVTDIRDQQKYATVSISGLCWLAQNINVGTRIDSSVMQTDNNVIEKYCYRDVEDSCNTYGGLYQWNEMMQYSMTEGSQGICPLGWHIPSHDEFTDLVSALGGSSVAGGKMKTTGTIEAGTGLWYDPNTDATNISGFSTLPGGSMSVGGPYQNLGYRASFWHYNTLGITMKLNFWISYDSGETGGYLTPETDALSIRCVKNE
ncbi:MAG: hypothetical protein K9G67_06710 [Bacteroidales bacterium]|nr:hypothetical protein [Bacteroidales bacterium]MCF8349589.1 hypothetical protein [Bacteroidales bacterium]MCF8376030.1 hypothetical protein [Bacteroidales bacterium]MCF8400437.1 hypothetical protein [Bacteroidales bacterium]